MLNYIWAGLIILSLVFALVVDVSELVNDRYRNGEPLPVAISIPGGYDAGVRRVSVIVTIDETSFQGHYGTSAPRLQPYAGELTTQEGGKLLHFAKDAALPEPLATIRSMTSSRNNDLRGTVDLVAAPSDTLVQTAIVFPAVRFVKLAAITQAAIDFAETAVTIALSLIGVLALWMGLLRIAEASGMMHHLVRLARPIIGRFFPEIPPDHPALGMIVLNLSANVLGLGNAATPLGIKAMEELQTLNNEGDTATNSMVMLLAMNTASVQLVPPSLLVAIMGLQVNQLFFSILITTAISLIIAVAAARLLGRMKRYRDTDPMLPAIDDEA